jgi:hypothetical protein
MHTASPGPHTLTPLLIDTHSLIHSPPLIRGRGCVRACTRVRGVTAWVSVGVFIHIYIHALHFNISQWYCTAYSSCALQYCSIAPIPQGHFTT